MESLLGGEREDLGLPAGKEFARLSRFDAQAQVGAMRTNARKALRQIATARSLQRFQQGGMRPAPTASILHDDKLHILGEPREHLG
jgi:hypothetical protein